MKKIPILGLIYIMSPPLYPADILTIARGNGQHPPFEVSQQNKLEGFHIDLVRSVAKMADISIRFKSYPWKRALQMVKYGKADAITYVGKTPKREKFIDFDNNNIISSAINHFIVHADRHDIK